MRKNNMSRRMTTFGTCNLHGLRLLGLGLHFIAFEIQLSSFVRLETQILKFIVQRIPLRLQCPDARDSLLDLCVVRLVSDANVDFLDMRRLLLEFALNRR